MLLYLLQTRRPLMLITVEYFLICFCQSVTVTYILYQTNFCMNMSWLCYRFFASWGQVSHLTMHQVGYFAIPLECQDPTFRDLLVKDIDPFLCTHINIGFAKIDENELQPVHASDVEVKSVVCTWTHIVLWNKIWCGMNKWYEVCLLSVWSLGKSGTPLYCIM